MRPGAKRCLSAALSKVARHIPDMIGFGLSQYDAFHLIDEISRMPSQGR
jgi:hypothetical protein